jgi:hypothetical protein
MNTGRFVGGFLILARTSSKIPYELEHRHMFEPVAKYSTPRATKVLETRAQVHVDEQVDSLLGSTRSR